MTNQTLSSDIRRYALVGAQARLLEITAEVEAIRRAFPELQDKRRSNSSGTRAGTSQTQMESDGGATSTSSGGRRRTMSAGQRKAVGDRMKRYWAARRAAGQGNGGSEASATSAEPAAASRAPRAKAATRGGRRGPRKMSAAARKRISDAQKKRWAARRKSE
jgi:hypothetical protein